jgi:hypothetical protein
LFSCKSFDCLSNSLLVDFLNWNVDRIKSGK